MSSSMPRVNLLIVALLVGFLTACGNNKPFDSTAWHKADVRERGRMSQNLVDSKLLVGRSIDQAKQKNNGP